MNPGEKRFSRIYLKAGGMYFSENPAVVMTVLGSCVSVILFHRRLGKGAICHGLLPRCAKSMSCNGDCAEGGRYVECSIRMLLRPFSLLGAAAGELEVKVFGGSDMFGTEPGGTTPVSVGRENVTTALQTIEREGLRVVSMDVGSTQGRKLFFNTRTGEVLLKRLKSVEVLSEPLNASARPSSRRRPLKSPAP